MTTHSPDVQYPIGRFSRVESLSADERLTAIRGIAILPTELRNASARLTDAQLDTPYRDGGWTVRQLVHHVADSHLNGYIRFHLGMTEEQPTIKPYDQDAWAGLPDGKEGPIEPSLAIIDGVHARWARLLGAMHATDFARAIVHPEWTPPLVTFDALLANYHWHGAHHVAHIVNLRRRKNWPV